MKKYIERSKEYKKVYVSIEELREKEINNILFFIIWFWLWWIIAKII